MDSVQARVPKSALFNNGNVSYELQILPQSKINILGKHEITNNVNIDPTPISLSDILNFPGYIRKLQIYFIIYITIFSKFKSLYLIKLFVLEFHIFPCAKYSYRKLTFYIIPQN